MWSQGLLKCRFAAPLASLNLASLDLTLVDSGASAVLVTGTSLNVASVAVTYQSGPYAKTGLEADAADSGVPVTAGAITGGGTCTANGAGATLIEQSAVGSGGQIYEAEKRRSLRT